MTQVIKFSRKVYMWLMSAIIFLILGTISCIIALITGLLSAKLLFGVSMILCGLSAVFWLETAEKERLKGIGDGN